MDCSLPGSSVHGTCPWDSPWTRILEWVPCPSSGDLPDPGIEPRSPALQADSLPSEPPGEPCTSTLCMCLVTQLCLTLCDPMDCSPPGSSVHGIFQARILEWVATHSSRGSSWPRNWTRVSCIAGGFFTSWATREDCTGSTDIKNRKLRD